MTTDNLEKFQERYQAGKAALERGQYQLSISNLEAAQNLVASNSRRGGEAQIWLLTAYQAANQIDEAIALAQELIVHPNAQTREQAQRILYIIKAPRLARPKEWMSEIPDLADAEPSSPRYVAARKKPSSKPLDTVNLTPDSIETKDNGFVWFALILSALTIGSLFWLS